MMTWEPEEEVWKILPCTSEYGTGSEFVGIWLLLLVKNNAWIDKYELAGLVHG